MCGVLAGVSERVLWPLPPHLSAVVKSCPDVGWDARNTAVHEVKHKDVLLPAENARKHSGMSHIACARGTELRAESNPRYAPWTKADSGYDAIFFFFFLN